MIDIDVRVLASTTVNLQQAIADGQFREDLYYRLSAFTMVLPPLRDSAGRDFPATASLYGEDGYSLLASGRCRSPRR